MTTSTLQQLTEARELMHQLIAHQASWNLRAHVERRINQLRRKLQAENEAYARDLQLLTQIFS